MKSQYFGATLVIIISLSACVPPRPATSPPTILIVEVTSTPLPTPIPNETSAPIPIPPTPVPTTGSGDTPSVEITRADADYVSGLIGPDTYCNDNYRVVIYAKTDKWYVQPFIDSPLTMISPEPCNWESFTHSWDKLAAFLVPSNYDPPATLSSQSCPPNLPGAEILASVCYSP